MFAQWTKRVTPKPEDIVFSYETRLGEAAIIPNNLSCCLGRRMGLLRPDRQKVFPKFLLYAYLGPMFQEVLRKHTVHGSTVDRIPLIEMHKFPINLPRLETQRRIAHILGTLDDKIELNRRTNETLEAMARAIFKSWFVDFDPVKAKAAGQKPFGMDDETAALFPSGFEDSELGPIPKGWRVRALYDCADFINGAAYAAFQPNEEKIGLPIVKIAELKSGITEQTKFSSALMPEKYRLNNGDILFSWSGNPDTSIDTFVWGNGPAWLNQHIFKVQPSENADRSFLLMVLKHLRPTFAEIARNKQTTGLGHVTVEDLKRLKIVQPSSPGSIKLFEHFAPLLNAVFQNALESKTLAQTRDLLLPKLLSGELEVAV